MIAVIFEVTPKETGRESYFSKAQELKRWLQYIDGFISVERFQSLSRPNTVLSLSFWRDEQAVQTWKNQMQHREAQQLGIDSLFEHYRIRIAQVVRDYDIHREENTK
ncbi:antibiotic biosynthesis monooxygenase [uncultured Microbulbifer sp.]|uniref:antibiotic biosynthesis monooxygenase family protein n=1 Tax=uncultured Microbulbifer sp. TaxID=348147 RepID=UPI002638F677|nr:antibiotic biosynthesis monooxygenase [uncultured Microbulbifer sp.]